MASYTWPRTRLRSRRSAWALRADARTDSPGDDRHDYYARLVANPHSEEVEALLDRFAETRDRLDADIASGLKLGERLRDAARTIGDASSGSWLGWHSRMYYGDFEEPPVADSWDPEWGGIHGYSDRWRDRSQAEVQNAVEQRAGAGLAELATCADRVREACELLQQEALIVLSPVCDLAGLDREAELLTKLEHIDWIVPPGNFIQALTPRQVMSRDSVALSQGIQAPLHLNVEAAIVSNTSTLASARDFLTDAIRLGRQARTKLKALPAGERGTAAMIGESAEARLARQLRRRSIALFAVLACAITVGVAVTLRLLVDDRLVSAVVIVAAVLLVAGLYALLVDRAHARWAVVAAAGVGGALAAVDQLLGHFE